MKNGVKKLTALLLAAAMLLACIPATAFAADKTASSFRPAVGQTIIVTAPHGVYMHEEPGENATRILALACGTHLKVLEVRTNGWLQVTCGGYSGWVENAASSDTGNWFGPYNETPDVYPYTNKQAIVLANVLNVHNAPLQLTNNIIDDLVKGQAVSATGYTSNGWTRVEYYRGQTKIVGYVSSVWVRLTDVTPETTTYTAPEEFTEIYGWSAQVKSSCSALNVHASPSVNASIITYLHAGDVVNILAESKTWYRISLTYNGRAVNGYIVKSYTKVLDAMENLRLNDTELTLKKGKKYQLLVRGNTGMSITTTWKSSNKKIAKVTSRGYVTAKKKGKATITCTIKTGNQTKKLKCKITVK